MDCLFCKIIKGEIPSDKVYEDELVYVFNDISPAAPTHFLIIPKEHISNLDEIDKSHSELLAHILLIASKLGKDFPKGYRLVNNSKEDGGQTVDHLHFHLLAERQLQWPPG